MDPVLNRPHKRKSLFVSLFLAMLSIALCLVVVVSAASYISVGSLNDSYGEIARAFAQDATRKDLNVARKIFETHMLQVQRAIDDFASRRATVDGLVKLNADQLGTSAREHMQRDTLHQLSIVNASGVVIARATSAVSGDNIVQHPLIDRALAGQHARAVRLEDKQWLSTEGLADKARIELTATEHARATSRTIEERGMLMQASAPIYASDGSIIGVALGSYLIAGNYDIVDEIKSTLYKDIASIGTATIFLDDVRISTNVKNQQGTRAVGTRVSQTVYETVVERGESYLGRAFVVTDWYITAYEPIVDDKGHIIGILYVGVLEQPFLKPLTALFYSSTQRLMVYYLVAFAVGALLTLALAFGLSRRFVLPVRILTAQFEHMARGNLNVERIDVHRHDELGQLGDAFNSMIEMLRKQLSGIRMATDGMRSASQKFSSSIGQISMVAASQLSSVAETGASVEQVLRAFDSSTKQAENIVESATQSGENSERGNAALTDNLRAVQDIRTSTDAIVQHMQRLQEQIKDIGEIIESVRELSEHSSLLAVNASIEAAKAGESGRGFAVVAAEVKSLASSSKDAAIRINKILDDVQRAFANVRAVTSSTSELVDNGVQTISESRNIIENLRHAIEAFSRSALKIQQTGVQQRIGVNEIRNAMAHIEHVANELVDSTRSMEATDADLRGITDKLSELVAEFQTQEKRPSDRDSTSLS